MSTWLLSPWLYLLMLHYMFIYHDFSGISCACERVGGRMGNKDAWGVHGFSLSRMTTNN